MSGHPGCPRPGAGMRTGAVAALAAAVVGASFWAAVALGAPGSAARIHQPPKASSSVAASPTAPGHLPARARDRFPAPAPAGETRPDGGRGTFTDMVHIPAGSYQPLYGVTGTRVAVGSFSLDRYPVTRGEYRRFLRDHPEWRRAVQAATANELPPEEDARLPVTGLPRAAAQAYCLAQGQRLPTTDEWEYVAAASETRRDGADDARFQQRLIELYTRPRGATPAPVGSTFRNAFGVYDLHGLVWEWTAEEAQAAREHAMAHAHHAASTGGQAQHDLGCAGSAVGASDTRAYAAFLRYAFRAGLNAGTHLPNLGFRCAR